MNSNPTTPPNDGSASPQPALPSGGQSFLTRQPTLILLFFLIITITVRVWFWYTTNLTLEDSLITIRYAENIAAGLGFVYNTGERVLGTTTPLWTLLLAAIKFITGADLIVATKIIGIIFDASTLAILFRLLWSGEKTTALLLAGLLSTSPAIAPISLSGMETSLLLLCMSLCFAGLERRSVLFSAGLVLTVLTRIDGAIFAAIMAGAALLKDRRWALRQIAIAAGIAAPWILFSMLYFGSVLPQSLLAKRALYRFGFSTSAAPFLNQFTPIGQTSVPRFAAKLLELLLLVAGIVTVIKRRSIFLPFAFFLLIYSFLFMTSGTMVFSWYLVPAIFASYFLLAEGVRWLVARAVVTENRRASAAVLTPVILLLGAANLFVLGLRTERFSELQQYEVHLRKDIGLWLKGHAPPGARVFLEPLGYIGYYAGPDLKIQDELGLVAPKVLELRMTGTGWYCRALATLQPDFVIQYAFSIDNNIAEGTQDRLFADDDEREWFIRNYEAIKIFDVSGDYPLIESREKKFILHRKVNDPTSPLPTEMKKGGFAGEILHGIQISRKFRVHGAGFSGHVGIP